MSGLRDVTKTLVGTVEMPLYLPGKSQNTCSSSARDDLNWEKSSFSMES